MIKLKKLLNEMMASGDYLETGAEDDVRFGDNRMTPHRQEQEYCNECGAQMYEDAMCKECGYENHGADQDHEVFMAQKSLKQIQSAAQSLMAKLGDDEKDIPAWIQDHITNAENYIKQASEGFYTENPHDQEMSGLYEMKTHKRKK